MSPEAFVARTSPARVALMILGALVFVALGAWLIGWLGEPPASRRFSPQMIYAIGWATIIFFGLAALFGLRMFGKRRDVLIIDE
ncbi:MAG: STM3941 family protein, partial [Sphingomonas sp.]